MSKWVCDECDWRGQSEHLLRAQNPFAVNDDIVGCPHCKEVNSMTMACDELDCWQQATCGTPTEGGYRQTCYRHKP